MPVLSILTTMGAVRVTTASTDQLGFSIWSAANYDIMSRTRRWIDDVDVRMSEMQELWESIASPAKPPVPRSTPKRGGKSTLIPIVSQTPEGLERMARAKEREQKRALENELNRRRLQEHHRNLRIMKSHRAEGCQMSPAPATPIKARDRSMTPKVQEATKKSYEQQSIEFQSARRALRKSLNGHRDINIEFVLPKEERRQTDNDQDPAILAQFGEQHDLRPVKRLLQY